MTRGEAVDGRQGGGEGGRGHHGGGVLQEAATAAAGVEGERLVLPPRPAADNGGEILGMA